MTLVAVALIGIAQPSCVQRLVHETPAPAQTLPSPVSAHLTDAIDAAMTTIGMGTVSGHVEASAVADAVERAAVVGSDQLLSAIAVADQTEVRYRWYETITAERTVEVIASEFGLPRSLLAELNPELDLDALGPGDELLVYRFDPTVTVQSRGAPNRGRLRNGMPMPDGSYWNVNDRAEAWGTSYTIGHLVRGLTYVGDAMPGAPTVLVADISRRRGGRNSPHLSHQSGRDVDLTYYIEPPSEAGERFTRATSDTLDMQRQWALLQYWLKREVIEYIFIDRRIQRHLYRYVRDVVGEDPVYLDQIFGFRGENSHAPIRHSAGHHDHIHVRFRCAEWEDRCSD